MVEQSTDANRRFLAVDEAELGHLLKSFNANPPALKQAIAEAELRIGRRLPENYTNFLSIANGGEGFIGGNAYVILWRAEELMDMQEAYCVSKFAPGLFLFGSDGGGEAYAYDFRTRAEPIVNVPFVGMDLKMVRELAPNLLDFLKYLASYVP